MGLGQRGSAEAILRIGHERYVCCSGLHFISYLFCDGIMRVHKTIALMHCQLYR